MIDFQCEGCRRRISDEGIRASYEIYQRHDGPPFLACRNLGCDYVYHVVEEKPGRIRVDPKSGCSVPENERGIVEKFFQ